MARLALPVSVTQPDALPIGPGAVLNGRYQVLQRHKAGPHGLNVVALDRERSRRVVIKILVPLASGRPSDPFGLTRLSDALDKVRSLQHRGCAHIQHTFTESVANAPSLCLVTERQSRPNLTTLLDQVGSFDAYRACAIFDAVADVIERAHQEGLLHLGLKPNNIFLDRVAGTSTAASVLVADLGLVDAIRQAAPAWPVNLDPQFSAPELLDAGPADVRADVYSLGAILAALLGGESAESAPLRLMEVAQRAMSNHPKNRYPDVSTLRENVHEALVATVAAPTTRTPVIEDDTLQPTEPKRMHTPLPPPAPKRERLAGKGGRRLMWASVAVAALVVGLVGTMVLGPPWVREYRSWAGTFGFDGLVSETSRATPQPAPAPVVGEPRIEAPVVAPPAEVEAPTEVAKAKQPAKRQPRKQPRARTQPRTKPTGTPVPTADPTPKRAYTNKVQVTSNPTGAVVFKDGDILGNTPLTVPLPNGDPVNVTVWLPNHPTKSVTLDGSTKSVGVTLARSTPAPAEPTAKVDNP